MTIQREIAVSKLQIMIHIAIIMYTISIPGIPAVLFVMNAIINLVGVIYNASNINKVSVGLIQTIRY